jgi:hypothetical protein
VFAAWVLKAAVMGRTQAEVKLRPHMTEVPEVNRGHVNQCSMCGHPLAEMDGIENLCFLLCNWVLAIGRTKGSMWQEQGLCMRVLGGRNGRQEVANLFEERP